MKINPLMSNYAQNLTTQKSPAFTGARFPSGSIVSDLVALKIDKAIDERKVVKKSLSEIFDENAKAKASSDIAKLDSEISNMQKYWRHEFKDWQEIAKATKSFLESFPTISYK